MLKKFAGAFTCSMIILVIPRQVEAAKIKLVPVSANGEFSIQNGELYLQYAGQRVVLEIQVSDWALDGDGLLHLVISQIESSGFGNDLGASLLPEYQSCPIKGDVNGFCDEEFGSMGRRCLAASELPGCPYTNCCQPAFIDQAHPQYLLAGRSSINAVDSDNLDLSFQFHVHCTCVGIEDNETPKYAGTLVLDVPAGADGTYTIGFRESGTLLLDGDNPIEIPMPYTQSPAVIHVEPFNKNRYLTFGSTAPAGSLTAFRVTMLSLHHPDPPPSAEPPPDFSAHEGHIRWVGQAASFLESPGLPDFFIAAPLQCGPHFAPWNAEGMVHAYGLEVVPDSLYRIDEVDISCPDLQDPGCYVQVATLRTSRWGDVEYPFAQPGIASQPDFGDITAIVRKFREQPGALITTRATLYGNIPDQQVDFQDITSVVDSFKGRAFPFSGPANCS